MRDHDQRTRHRPADRARQENGLKDLQEIISKVAARERVGDQCEGAQVRSLSPDKQASPMKALISVGADVSKNKPALAASYEAVTGAAARARYLAPAALRQALSRVATPLVADARRTTSACTCPHELHS